MGGGSLRDGMPNDARNEDSGQFTSKYSDETFLDALGELGATGTPELATEVGCDYDTALRRLSALAERGVIDRRRFAGSILWSRPDATAPADEEASA